jgi:tetratricopeptide (TPR) repeat protein
VTKATENRARVLLAMEKIDDAKTEFSSLTKLPGVSDDVKIEVEFWLVWIDEQVATRRNDQAALGGVLKAYEGLASKLGGKSQFEDLARRCQVGKASCQILLGRAAEAKTLLENLLKDTKDKRTLAAIYNKLGTATWRADTRNKDAQREALKHYQRVVTLYGDAQGAEDDCAEAMFHSGELFRELKDQGPDWAARARREWSEVVDQFPGSVWAQKSKEALAGR